MLGKCRYWSELLSTRPEKWGAKCTYETEPQLRKVVLIGRSEVNEAAGRQHILFCKYLWGHLCCEYVKARRAGAEGDEIVCSLCKAKMKSNWHLFSDCTNERMVEARRLWVEVLQKTMRKRIAVRKNGKRTSRSHSIPKEVMAMFDLELDGTMGSWETCRGKMDESAGSLLARRERAVEGDVIRVVERGEEGEGDGDDDADRGVARDAVKGGDGVWTVGLNT